MLRRLPLWTAWMVVAGAASIAGAWGAHGHRIVTRLALDGLGPDLPAWLHDTPVVERIAEQSNEPDRWRNTKRVAIGHEANPEHYIDVDDLDPLGLTLAGLPEFRYDYMKAMVRARLEHPERLPAYNPEKDADHVKEWPGFLPYAIAEHFAKLQSSFNTLRILESVKEKVGERDASLAQARENVIYEMGILSHFVGDAAQPLHTTRHHHGWAGPNPAGYTRENGFHAYIDSRVVELHALTYESLRPTMRFETRVSAADPWKDCLGYIQRSFDRVEPLYQMEKSGELTGPAGKAFISERLCDGGAMLAALYNAAWEASKPTDREVAAFLRYSERGRRPTGSEPETPAPPAPPPTAP
jgi:hypothetical protein